MKNRYNIAFLLSVGLYILACSSCILCDGNTDKIVDIDYDRCSARFKKFGDSKVLSLKLNNIEVNTVKECKCIFDSFTKGFGNRRIIVENGFLIKKHKNAANIYVETMNNELILWNEVINKNKNKLCQKIDSWDF